MKGIEKNKSNRAGKGLSLWQKATVFLSLMSWFTTEQGFQNTVFVGQNPAWAMFASFAIQTILLAGVLYGAHILEHFRGFQRGVCIIIWASVAIVSIAFSYISISNSMYFVDFAVDGNQVTEKFIRETVQDLEQNNLKRLDEIRPELVKSLRNKGYDVMNTDIQTKAKNYVNVTADFTIPDKEEYLAELEEKYLTKEERKKFVEDKCMRVTGEYAQKAYPKTYAEARTPEYWKKMVAQTINSLNDAGYQQYDNVYQQESVIINKYNELRKKINDENKFPTLDQMKALKDSCERLEVSITDARDNIRDYKIENRPYANGKKKKTKKKGTYNIITANDYVDKAIRVFDELSASVKSLKNCVEELIEHSYGTGNKSVDEILALVGNSNADITELDKARRQMLEAQGSILKAGGNLNATLIKDVNKLMSDLNNYVDRARYHYDIQVFKEECLNCTFNIVKSKESIQNNRLNNSSVTGQAVTGQAVTGQAVESLGETMRVIDVTPELWISNRKIHMSKLNALIYNYPVSDDDNYYKEDLGKFGDQTHRYEKVFLDTSESEKAFGLLFGKNEYFPNKGKAILALAFAAFLDLGAAMVGILIYLVKKKGI